MSIQPLNDRMPLVNPDGTPTQFFLRQLQDRGITIDGKITAEQAAEIAQGLIDDWALARDINTTAPILGGGNLSADLTISHDVSGVTPGTYGDATNSPQITVDDEGHVTGVTNVPISGGGGGGGNWWFNPPAASSFSLTSGDGTNPILTDDTAAGLLFDFGAYTASDDNRFAYRTLTNSALDWEVVATFNPLLLDSGIGFGVAMHNSVNNRFLTFLVRDTGWRMYNWTTLTSFNSIASANFNPGGMTSKYPFWLKMKRVSNAISFQVSADGKQWYQVGSTTVSGYVGDPTRVGLVGNYATTSNRGYAAVENFSLTGPAV